MNPNSVISNNEQLGYGERIISDIVKYLKEWLRPTTAKYNEEMKYQAETRAKQEAQQKQAEIEKAQAELRIKQSLIELF